MRWAKRISSLGRSVPDGKGSRSATQLTQFDWRVAAVGERQFPLHHGCTIFSIPDIVPVGQLPAPASVSERLSGDFRLSELPAPDLPFKTALEGRQYAANFDSSNTSHRPGAVGRQMGMRSFNVRVKRATVGHARSSEHQRRQQ